MPRQRPPETFWSPTTAALMLPYGPGAHAVAGYKRGRMAGHGQARSLAEGAKDEGSARSAGLVGGALVGILPQWRTAWKQSRHGVWPRRNFWLPGLSKTKRAMMPVERAVFRYRLPKAVKKIPKVGKKLAKYRVGEKIIGALPYKAHVLNPVRFGQGILKAPAVRKGWAGWTLGGLGAYAGMGLLTRHKYQKQFKASTEAHGGVYTPPPLHESAKVGGALAGWGVGYYGAVKGIQAKGLKGIFKKGGAAIKFAKHAPVGMAIGAGLGIGHNLLRRMNDRAHNPAEKVVGFAQRKFATLRNKVGL